MPVAIEVKKVMPRLYVGIRRTVKRDGLGSACAEVLSRVAGWLASQGKQPAGGPIMVYHSINEATGDFLVQPAYFVGPAITSEAEFTIGETAGGDALFAVHAGPYSSLGETWAQLFNYAARIRRAVTKSSWEVYLNTPGDAAEADLRTEIYVPID
jgi:effector-binding domain-containing protein